MSQANESFAQLLDASQPNSLRPGALIQGEVIKIGSDYVTIDAGLKSESIVPVHQFKDVEGKLEIAVGDVVDVTLESLEDGYGSPVLSREKAKRDAAWSVLESAYANDEVVVGRLVDQVKGGFTVEVNSVRAFLPRSLLDIRPLRDYSFLENTDLELKLVKMDKKRNNIVVSRRAVIEEETSEERTALLNELEECKDVKGIVKNLTDYGAFVDLGGIDGLLHITDIAWKRVKHPSEVLTVGDEIMVRVLSFDKEKQRVSLGLKQLSGDPWQDIIDKFPVGSRLFGQVTNLTEYGCFVEIQEGIEGLVHMSEMDWTNKNIHPSKLVQISDEVEVMILDIDEKRRRISLGMKQCVPNPWKEFENNYAENDKIKGKIKSITDFGVFVGLEGGIDGLVHLSDISWTETGEKAIRNLKKGDEVDTVILAVDAERERISLGMKQLQDDPYAEFMLDHPKGTQIQGKITEVDSKHVVVDIAEGIVGSMRITDFTRTPEVGDKVDAYVTSGERNKHMMINLSAQLNDAPASNSGRAPKGGKLSSMDGDSKDQGTTFGDLIKAQLGQSDEAEEAPAKAKKAAKKEVAEEAEKPAADTSDNADTDGSDDK